MQVQVQYFDEAGEVKEEKIVEGDSPLKALQKLGYDKVCMSKRAMHTIPMLALNDTGQQVIAFKRSHPAFVFDEGRPAVNLEGSCEIVQHHASVVAREAGAES